MKSILAKMDPANKLLAEAYTGQVIFAMLFIAIVCVFK